VVPLPARDVVYDPRTGRLYASLDSAAGARAGTVVAIDPATGAVTGSVPVGASPGRLALSDDGTALWVAVDGTGQVVRLALPGLTPGTSFSPGPERVTQMEVMPGHPGTVVLQQEGCCGTAGDIAVLYDNGVRRPRTAPGPYVHSIAFGEDGDVVYAADAQTTLWAFHTYRVAADGLSETKLTEREPLAGSQRMVYAAGRVYGLFGQVADAQRHELLGTFANVFTASSMAVDAGVGRVYFFDSAAGNALRVFDGNTLALLGTFSVPGASRLPGNPPERLLRWGTDGLVLSDGTSIHILHSPLFGP
jgi:YVTN family beta-propeller protein